MSSREGSLGASISSSTGIGSATDGGAWKEAAGASPGAPRVVADDHPRGASDPPVQAVSPQQLLHDDVVVVGIVHGAHLDRFAEVRIVGEPKDGDALEALVLKRLEELCPHEDQAFYQRLPGVALLGRLEGAVEVVEDVDEFEQKPFAPLIEASLRVLGDAVAEPLVLGPQRAIGRENLGEPVFGEARPPVEGFARAASGPGSRASARRRGAGASVAPGAASSFSPPASGLSGPPAGSSSDNGPPGYERRERLRGL